VDKGGGSNLVASILYDGGDSDGVVREGAFRARTGVAWNSSKSQSKSHSKNHAKASEDALGSSDGSRWVAAIFSEDVVNLEEKIIKLRESDSMVPIWLVESVESAAHDGLSQDRLKTLLNRGRIRRRLPRRAEEIEKAIRESIQERDERAAILRSRKELGTRNRQLHDLQENLEKIVTERTAHLSDAERELHRRTQETRDLVRFIKELSQTELIEEILQLLNQEIRSFNDVVRPPILAVVSPEFGARLHFQQNRHTGRAAHRALEKGWGSKAVSRLWSRKAAIRFNDAEDQAYLAQELGRPMPRTIAIPLAKELRGSEAKGPGPLLIFEHGLDVAKAEEFKRFLIPRLEPLSSAIDRIIINREMRAASRLWEATFDGIADPIAVLSSDFRVLRMNRAFARYETPSGERSVSSPRCYEMFAGRTSPCDGCSLKKVFESGKPSEWQVRRDHDVYEVNGYPIHLGEPTEPVQAEPAQTVIHHYADITKSLELKSYAFQGEKMAAIGLMAGNIAHELNNPLAGLRSLAQVLAHDSNYPDTVRKDMKEIELAAGRSSAIIRDLLEFSQADDRVRETVSLNVVADRALNMVKTALHEHRVDIDWAEDADVMVEVDPHLLQHVIFNIVNNACQAMKETGELTIRTRRSLLAEDGKSIERKIAEIEIADTGPGVPPQILSRIFEPFFTTKEAGQGTGLGLSMSRMVIENFGGVIEVQNRTEGQGAVFTVRLPLKAVEGGAHAESNRSGERTR
jgi:signal transduction histidine kinase/PAS domain-containing protein